MSERLDVFENTLADLHRRGFKTINLDELYAHMSGAKKAPPDSVVLTFDDGYLDNWVYVAPLLRKYGMCGIVYVSPDFVQPAGEIRPTLVDQQSGLIECGALPDFGFMNWHELRILDDEGVLEVQSHALTHTWYFSEPTVIDIHQPRDIYPYPWLSWNARPERKPYYLNEDQQHFVPWGLPVFRHEKALITRRFIPERDLLKEITKYVEDAGGAAYFDRPDWRATLSKRFSCLSAGADFPGIRESREEYRARVLDELIRSRKIIGDELGREVRFLSWPGGGVNNEAAELAIEAGYVSWTLSSWQKPSLRNRPGTDPAGIKRVAGRSKVHWRGRWIRDGGSWWIVQRMLAHQGSLLSSLRANVRKLLWFLGDDSRGKSS